jgi:hypothetical protein
MQASPFSAMGERFWLLCCLFAFFSASALEKKREGQSAKKKKL